MEGDCQDKTSTTTLMGWLWLVGSIKLQVSFAKEPYKTDDILQKRTIILSILLTVATPYSSNESHRRDRYHVANPKGEALLWVSFHLYTGLFSFVYRSLFICMQVSFHLYAGLFLFVCRSLFTCIQISFHLYTGLFSFVYRSLFVCIQVSFHLYAGFFSFVCRSLFICIQVSFYLYTYLFSFVYRFLFMCIQVSFNWSPCSSLMRVHRRPVYK